MVATAHWTGATPCQGLRTTALGRNRRFSSLEAYAFFHHKIYDAGKESFVPSNVIFDAQEVMLVMCEVLRLEKPMLTLDWMRVVLWPEHSYLLLFGRHACGAALQPADTCEGSSAPCPGQPIRAGRKQ